MDGSTLGSLHLLFPFLLLISANLTITTSVASRHLWLELPIVIIFVGLFGPLHVAVTFRFVGIKFSLLVLLVHTN